MKIMRMMGALLLFAVMASLAGCGGLDSQTKKALKKFGPGMDEQRKALGILPAPADCTSQFAGNNRIRFVAASGTHTQKVVVFKKDLSAPVEETDVLMFRTEGPPDPENGPSVDTLQIVITAAYNGDGSAVAEWRLLELDSKKGTEAVEKKVSADVIDALLKKHGLK
jgi:hypothetical protein